MHPKTPKISDYEELYDALHRKLLNINIAIRIHRKTHKSLSDKSHLDELKSQRSKVDKALSGVKNTALKAETCNEWDSLYSTYMEVYKNT